MEKGIDASSMRIRSSDGYYTLVVTRWNSKIVEGLSRGARRALISRGITEDRIRMVHVPGAFEIPLACQAAARRTDCDAVIALGAVIRGETPHFEYVAGECTRGIGEVALSTGKPLSFGVLTVNTFEQALARSNDDENNKGAEAALCAIEMVNILRELTD